MITDNDPFASVLAEHEKKSTKQPTISSQTQQNDVFSDVTSRQETLGEKIPRWGAQAAARSWEMAGELPGSLVDFMKFLGPSVAQTLVPENISKPVVEGVKKIGEATGLDKLSLPRPGQLREVTKELTGGYTEPANRTEEVAGQTLQDIESTFVPLGPVNKGAKLLKTLAPKWQSIARHIAAPLAANLAKESAKSVGVGEKGQELTKIGTWILTDFLHPGQISKYGQHLFDETGRLSQGQMVPFSGIKKRFDTLRTKWREGVPDTAREGALTWMDKLEKKVDAKGNIHMPELVQGRKDANSLINEHGGFDVGKNTRDAVSKMTQEIKQSIIEPTETYLARANPKLGETWHGANDIWAAKESSEQIRRYVGRQFKKAAKSSGLAQLVHGGYGTALGVALPASKFGGVLHQIGKSAEARKYYGNVLADAIRHNGSGVTANLSKLDDILYKMEQQEKKKNKT